MAKIYLIPTTLGDGKIEAVIPQQVIDVINNTKVFVVENLRSARRYLKKVNRQIDISELKFFELNKNTDSREFGKFLKPIKEGLDIGIISEAGCPAVADPGSGLVDLAHRKGIDVVPMVGPSSILMSLMGSGLNGQNFAFNGYLPIEKKERNYAIKKLELLSGDRGQTQIFIETPYRNNKLVEAIIAQCANSTKLCIAANISCENEFIKTKTIAEWKHTRYDFHKQPAIFLLQKQ